MLRATMVSLLAAAACDDDTTGGECERRVSLVDHTLWEVVAEDEDPFGTVGRRAGPPARRDAGAGRLADAGPSDGGGADGGGAAAAPDDAGPSDGGGFSRGRCDEAAFGIEQIGGDRSLSVDTRFCGWATVRQPLLIDLHQGERVHVRVWHFRIDIHGQALATLGLRIGDADVWTSTVPLPTDGGGLLGPDDVVRAPADFVAGTPIYWHVDNHGDNSWNLIEASVDRPCEATAASGAAGDDNGSHDEDEAHDEG